MKFSRNSVRDCLWFVAMMGAWFAVWYLAGWLQGYYPGSGQDVV